MKKILIAIALFAVVILPNVWASNRDNKVLEHEYKTCERIDGLLVPCE